MGKLVAEMTKEERLAQRERARRNYFGLGRKCVTCGEPATGWKYCDKHKAYSAAKEQRTNPGFGRSNILQAVMDGKI